VAEDIALEDLIAPQDMVVTFSHGGYVKSQRSRTTGAKGAAARQIRHAMKEDDFIERLFIAHSHDYLCAFSNPAGSTG